MKTAIKPNQSTKPLLHSLSVAMTSALLMGVTALPSRADITFYDVTKARSYVQDSNSQPVAPSFYFLDARVFSDNPNDYTDVIAEYSDGPSFGDPPEFVPGLLSPLTVVSPTQTFYRSPDFNSESDFNTTFPNGSAWSFQFSGGTLGAGNNKLLFFPEIDLYPEIPFLTGTTFSDLQGLNPSQPFTFNTNGFSAIPEADFSDSFLRILRSSDFQVPFESFFSDSITMPANTLAPDTQYIFSIYNRIGVLGNTDGLGFGVFSSRTEGTFTTGSIGSIIGTTPENPFLPILNDPSNPNGFSFLGVPVIGGEFFFFDPDVAVGYDYAVTGDALFASVLIPTALPNGDSNFILELPGFGNFPLISGTPFDLLAVNYLGFSNFRISDIDTMEMLDPTNPLAFVTGLNFTSSGTVNVTQNPIVVNIPEPSSLLSFGLLGLGFGMKKLKK